MEFDQIKCPKCGAIAVADFVDIGVGMQQCGPYSCETCGWIQEVPVIIEHDDECPF